MTEDVWTFRLYCTDRDKHEPQEVHCVEFHGPLEDLRPEHLAVGAPSSMLELDCQSCRRNVRRRNEWWMERCRAVIELMRSGHRYVEVDLSKLNL